MLRTEKMILKKTDEIDKWLSDATAIYDQALFYLRQEYFQAKKENKQPNYKKIKLYDLAKTTESWKNSNLDINAKQYILRKVNNNWTSFHKALKSFQRDKSKFKGLPKIPGYLSKRNKSTILIFDRTRLKGKDFENNTLSLPKSNYFIKIPKYIDIHQIKCIIVKKFYGKVKLNISYEKDVNIKKLNKNNYLGIDIGVENIVSITTDNQIKKSWIVKGGCIKSINQFYNKKLAKRKSILETVNNQKTSRWIQKLHMKRNNKLEYEFHCLSKKIIDLCLENNIGNIVIGHNKNWKNKCDLGKKMNQKFIQIPFNSLIQKIQYKTEEVGISFVQTEESFTSKIDHLANEDMKKQDNYLGKRIKRGLFESSCNKILNADINGAIGILRKKNVFSDADLISLRNRGDVVSPLVLKYKP